MQIDVKYDKLRKKIALKGGSNALDILIKLSVNPEMVLIKRRNEIIPDSEKLRDKDKIEIINVVSGG